MKYPIWIGFFYVATKGVDVSNIGSGAGFISPKKLDDLQPTYIGVLMHPFTKYQQDISVECWFPA